MTELINQLWEPELTLASNLVIYLLVTFLIGILIALGILIFLILKKRF